MPRFKVQGKHYMTNEKHTFIYDADDKSQAEKRGLDDGLLVEKTILIEDETDDGKRIDTERKFLDNKTNDFDENIEKPFQQRLNAVRIERKKSYIGGLLTVIAILVVIGFFGTSNKNKNHLQSNSSAIPTTHKNEYVTPTTPKAEPITVEKKSIEYMLATINAGGYVSEDHITVARFRSLLQQLSATYRESPQQIADMSVAAHKILKDNGIDEKLINMMEAMNLLFPRKIENLEYAEYVSAYTALRQKGYTHEQAVDGLRELMSRIISQ